MPAPRRGRPIGPPDAEFARRVHALVAAIPAGRLMSYGQIAALCGRPRAARMVGRIAHDCDDASLPWHRVVHADGALASGFAPAGVVSHRLELEAEGVPVDARFRAPVAELRWWPARSDHS